MLGKSGEALSHCTLAFETRLTDDLYRIGVVFVFQHRIFRVLSWDQPTHTLSALAVYSFICLDPQLLAVLPLVLILLFIMVPAFIARHPPTVPTMPGKVEPYTAHGGPIAPPPEVKAVSEMSKVGDTLDEEMSEF